MITFITAFKTFDVFYGAVQRSALFSYELNEIPVVAVSTEPGNTTDENCSRFSNITLCEGVKTGKDMGFKTNSPNLKDMLHKSLELVDTPLVGLINADNLIPENFKNTVEQVTKKFGDKQFTVVTRRDVDLLFEVDTVEKLNQVFEQDSVLHNIHCSSDLFITSKKNFEQIAACIPEFILGRYGWDNWMHYYAMANFRTYNGTRVYKILHCRHNHEHIINQEGRPGRYALSSVHNLSHLRNMQNIYGQAIRINNWNYLEL